MKVNHSKPSRGKKFNVKRVRFLIRSGINYCTQLSKHCKVSKSYMSRYLRKMLEDNEIKIDVIDCGTKYYSVVEKRVNQKCLTDWLSGSHVSSHYYSDALKISYGILNYDEYFIPDKDWMLGNTLMKGITIDDIFIQIANDKTITFVFPKIYGKDPQDCIVRASIKSIEIRKKFLDKYPDFTLTPYPTNYNAGCLGTTQLKPIINDLNPKLPIKTDEYTIDSTPEKGSFEMKIKDNPLETAEKMQKLIDNMLEAPERLERIESGLEILIKLQILRETDKLPTKKELEDLINYVNISKKPKKELRYVG